MAIVGTADLDVTQINVEAAPFNGVPRDCRELGGDGIDDLSTKSGTEAIVADPELNDLPGSASAGLVVRGELSAGTGFAATDCVGLTPPGSGSEPAPTRLRLGDDELDDLGGLFADYGTMPPAAPPGRLCRSTPSLLSRSPRSPPPGPCRCVCRRISRLAVARGGEQAAARSACLRSDELRNKPGICA